MAGLPGARVEVVVARTVDRFVDRFDFAALGENPRIEALHEIAELRSSLGRCAREVKRQRVPIRDTPASSHSCSARWPR